MDRSPAHPTGCVPAAPSPSGAAAFRSLRSAPSAPPPTPSAGESSLRAAYLEAGREEGREEGREGEKARRIHSYTS